MIVSHATMGNTDGEGMSVNDVSVQITALRNELYLEAKADRDTLAAANAALEAKVAGLVDAARPFLKTAVLADSASLLRAVNGIRAALATQEAGKDGNND